jgi:transcriptional regulator with XRE-family HTH domain
VKILDWLYYEFRSEDGYKTWRYIIMNFGEKLKEARKKAGLSQEQLADKLCVSRQAVTKWENEKGMPDIENLKAISDLLDVSIDSLLDYDSTVSNTIMKEAIKLDDYKKSGKCRSKQDACVKAKYGHATEIYALIRAKKLSAMENIIDFIVQPGVLQLADYSQDMSAYYLVQLENKQILVNVTKEFIISKELNKTVLDKKFVIGNNKFKKAYTLMV